MTGRNETTLRLALGMRGGVSLAVWIGGAVAELDAMCRPVQDTYASRLLAVGRYGDVEIDVMSGASAGGLNAVLAAAAMVGGKSVSEMRPTWIEVAGLSRLLDERVSAEPRRRSLLDGAYFRAEIDKQVAALLGGSPTKDRLRHRLDVFLSATVLGGREVAIVDDEFSRETARRLGALFHFRHFADDAAVSDLCLDDAVAALGKAARTTASFPTAFEAVEFSVDALPGRLQLPGSPAEGRAAATVRLLDGGVVDNIPVSRALDAIPSIPARTATNRWLVYMQPSPDVMVPSHPPQDRRDTVPGLFATVGGILGGFMSESILDDVEVLRRHNRDAVESWAAWSALVGTLPLVPPAVGPPERREDAARIVALLLDPAREMSWRAIGETVRCPLTTERVRDVREVRSAVESALANLPPPERDVRPFATLARTAAMLIRWSRLIEAAETRHADTPARETLLGPVSRAKITAYHHMQLAQLLNSAGDMALLGVRRDDIEAAVGAMAASVSALRRSAEIDRLATSLPLAGLDDLAQASVGDTPNSLLLRSLYTHEFSPSQSGGHVVETMRSALGRVAVRLSGIERKPADLKESGESADRVLFATLACRIRESANAHDTAVAYLELIDRLTVGVHAGRAAGQAGHIDYVRVGGSNLSPLCISATGTDGFAFDGPRFSAPMLRQGDGDLAPKLKLAGSDLANFSAFISAKWRANDWMWGRLDAAKSMVDLVTSHKRMPDDNAAYQLVHAVLTAPFDVPTRALREELEAFTTALWLRHALTIRDEIAHASTASADERLVVTKRVLVLRRQWEILANELPEFFRCPLEPEGSGSPTPDTLADQIAEYQRTPRSIGAVWGRGWCTGLGIRAAYAFWSASRPRTGWKRWLRWPFKPFPMALLGIALARNRALASLALAINLIVMPRLSGVGKWIALLVALIAAGLLGFAFRGRPRVTANPELGRKGRLREVPLEPGASWMIALTVGAFVYGVVVDWFLLPCRLGRSIWPGGLGGWHFVGNVTWETNLAAVGGTAATFLLWHWARIAWRVVVAIVVGLIIGFWTIFSGWHPPAEREFWHTVVFSFGSMWWGVIFAVTLTTLVAHTAFRNRWKIARMK